VTGDGRGLPDFDLVVLGFSCSQVLDDIVVRVILEELGLLCSSKWSVFGRPSFTSPLIIFKSCLRIFQIEGLAHVKIVSNLIRMELEHRLYRLVNYICSIIKLFL
jgi:hypothetical protein